LKAVPISADGLAKQDCGPRRSPGLAAVLQAAFPLCALVVIRAWTVAFFAQGW